MKYEILNKLALFIGGAILGSAITYKIVKDRYEILIDEEVRSVKETYDGVYKPKHEDEDTDESLEDEDEYDDFIARHERDKTEYGKIASQYKQDEKEDEEENMEDEAPAEYYETKPTHEVYYDPLEDKEERTDMEDMVAPYTITPDEFGDTGYEKTCLTMYANGFIEDDYGDLMDEDDVERLLGGEDNLKMMGEFEPDLLYIRNENYRVDYEIARDLNDYKI